MNKLKRTFDDHPLSFLVALVAFALWVLGISLPAPSMMLAASVCFGGAIIIAMVFDL